MGRIVSEKKDGSIRSDSHELHSNVSRVVDLVPSMSTPIVVHRSWRRTGSRACSEVNLLRALGPVCHLAPSPIVCLYTGKDRHYHQESPTLEVDDDLPNRVD